MSDFTNQFTGKKSSSSSSFANQFSGKGKKKRKERGGFLGGLVKAGKAPLKLTQKAAGDIEEITTGAVPGAIATGKAVGGDIAQVVEDTVRIVTGKDPPRRVTKPGEPGRRTKALAGAVGQSYAEMYGPLVRGDWRTFLNNVYEDPVFFALDAATIASLGLKGVTAARIIPSKSGRVIQLKTANGETVVTKPLARGELRAQLQSAAANARNRKGVYAAKVKQRELTRKNFNTTAGNAAFNRALSKIRGDAKVATFLRASFDREALDAYTEYLRSLDTVEAKKSLRIITKPKVQALFDNPTPRMGKVLDEARAVGEKQRGMIGVDPARADSRRFRPAQIAQGARYDPEADEWVGGPSIEELRGRGLDPIYLPHASETRGFNWVPGRGGGLGVPARVGNAKLNKGSLQLAGQLILDPAVLNTSFMKAARFQHYTDIHNTLIEQAVKVSGKAPGYTLIRRSRSERIPPKERMQGDFAEWASTHLDDEGEFATKESGLTTTSLDDAAVDAEGRYLAVPDAVARALTGEFTRQNRFFYWMNRNPMRVWRALVLGLRPAYLVNNMIGNTLMYLVHSSEPQDLKYLAEGFKQFVRKSEHGQVDALLERHFAGQVRGGFIATQYPDLAPSGPLASGAAKVVGAIPALDRRWEQALRRAKVKAELKKHPKLREHAERMGGETSYFEKIAQQLPATEESGVRLAQGDTLDDVLTNMGARGRERDAFREIESDPETGLPRQYKREYAIRVPGSEQPIEYVFRAISEEEWLGVKKNGYMQSDGRMNLSPDEGTVAAFEDPSFYLPGKLGSNKPGKYEARIVKIRLKPNTGWRYDTDGYMKTSKRVPLGDVEMVTPKLEGTRGTRLTRGGQEVDVMPDFQPRVVRKPSILDENPDIVTQVYERVNDALGNYDSMSAVEKGAIRNLFPFYAWYRAIAGVSLKLTLEQPLKVNLLARLGQVAIEQNLAKGGFKRNEVPVSILGFIPQGTDPDGRVRGWNTANINPYATNAQLAAFLSAATEGPGKMGKTLPGANPYLVDALSYIFGQTPQGYRTTDVPGGGTVEALPQWRLINALLGNARDGDTFNDRDAYDELLRQLGIPYARVSKTAAKRVVER